MTEFKILPGNNIAVLTGAGISAESGLKTFRDNNGLWEHHRVEDVATPEAFANDPELVWKFYKQRYYQLADVKPNPAHYALVKLEKYLDSNFNLITQNVDGLHYSAGSKNIIEMHGSLLRCFCIKCGMNYKMKNVNLNIAIPSCYTCGGYLRPDIVWFGEIPYFMEKINNIMRNIDYFMVIGTSGVVYPAAQFLPIALMSGAETIGINLEAPANDQYLNSFFKGRSGKILPGLIDTWIGKGDLDD